MSQPQFLLNFRWRKPARIFQAAKLTAEYPEVRSVKYHTMGGLRVGHSVGTGRIDRRKLDIKSPDISSYVFRVPATAEGIKAVLRRIRPQESTLLDAIDAEMAEVQSALDALKQRRKEVVHTAWLRGNVVRLKEVEQLLPEGSANR